MSGDGSREQPIGCVRSDLGKFSFVSPRKVRMKETGEFSNAVLGEWGKRALAGSPTAVYSREWQDAPICREYEPRSVRKAGSKEYVDHLYAVILPAE